MARQKTHRVFLDANVIFSAAWKEKNEIATLWRMDGVHLVTSDYVVEEVRRNLRLAEQVARMEKLLEPLEVLTLDLSVGLLPPVLLPGKDIPVLLGAVQAKAEILLTGDKRHFGHLYGRRTQGVLVLPPAMLMEHLRTK
jgi:predicted nucleic acid-binding protein